MNFNNKNMGSSNFFFIQIMIFLSIQFFIPPLLNFFKFNEQEQVDEIDDDFKQQLSKVKKKISVNFSDQTIIQAVFEFIVEFCAKKTLILRHELKTQWRDSNNKDNSKSMKEYLNFLLSGVDQLKSIILKIKEKTFQQLQIHESLLRDCTTKLANSFDELFWCQSSKGSSVQIMSVPKIKNALRFQIEYINKNMEQLSIRVVQVTKEWEQNKKNELPLILSIVVVQGAFCNHPEIDINSLIISQIKMQHFLKNELMEIQGLLNTFLNKLKDRGVLICKGGRWMGMSIEGLDQLQQLQEFKDQNPKKFQEMFMSTLNNNQL